MSMGHASRRLVFDVVREVLLVTICAAGAWLFLNHGILYLRGDSPPPVSREAYILTAAVLYLFVRSVSLLAGSRLPAVRRETDAARCPECDAPIDLGDIRTPRGAPRSAPPKGHGAGLVVPLPVAASARPVSKDSGDLPHAGSAKRVVRKAWKPPWMAERQRLP